jgi:hypothetical protein
LRFCFLGVPGSGMTERRWALVIRSQVRSAPSLVSQSGDRGAAFALTFPMPTQRKGSQNPDCGVPVSHPKCKG